MNSTHSKGRAFDADRLAEAEWAFFNWAAPNSAAHAVMLVDRFLEDGRNVHPIGGHNGHVHFSI